MSVPNGEPTHRRGTASRRRWQWTLARGHGWLTLMESGQAKSLWQIAQKAGVESSHVNHVVNLNTLAPEIVRRFFMRHCRRM